jgi:hypothetical protein
MGWAGTDRLTAVPNYFFPAAIRCDPYGAIPKRIAPVTLDWRNTLRYSALRAAAASSIGTIRSITMPASA